MRLTWIQMNWKKLNLETPFIRGSCRQPADCYTRGIRHVHGRLRSTGSHRRPVASFKPIASQANRGISEVLRNRDIGQFNNDPATVSAFRELGGYVISRRRRRFGCTLTRRHTWLSASTFRLAKRVTVQVVYYETSDQENLVGGVAYCAERR